jgi:GAF domain-containing protein
VEPTETTDTPPAPPSALPWSPTERALLVTIALCAAVALQQVLAMLRRI